MFVIRVGGLFEIVVDGKEGYVVEVNFEVIVGVIVDFFLVDW